MTPHPYPSIVGFKMAELSHIDAENRPGMVDVSHKGETIRQAVACGRVRLPQDLYDRITDGDIQTAKGPVFQTAIIGGTLAVKKTSELIPFCHPLPVDGCRITLVPRDPRYIDITCMVRTTGKTGVEMEALQGVNGAALTLYDMCKALSQDIVIEDIHLVEKTGGKSDYASTP